MAELRDIARAKLNLTLEVKGRRSDLYHELVSLVAFAEFGDELAFVPDAELALSLDGPFGGLIDSGGNLVIEAARAAKAAAPELRLGRFRLAKKLPVAAGLGGGSADAAAALRLLQTANPGLLPDQALGEIATKLGSDVTTCLASRPALMTGRGEVVAPVRGFPRAGVLLVNSGDQLPTAKVYAALGAPQLTKLAAAEAPDFGGDFARLVAYAANRANDLEAAAMRLAPGIIDVLGALRKLPGAELVRLSGSGATCFALFATFEEAERAATSLATEHSSWWVQATMLG